MPQDASPQSPAVSRSVKKSEKLRDSCHTCAVAKVKCPKEKPHCSRCTRRGLACEYFQSKRPGRKRDSHHSTENRNETSSIGRRTSSADEHWTSHDTSGSTPIINKSPTPCSVSLESPQVNIISQLDTECPTDMTNFDDFFLPTTDFLELDSFNATRDFLQGNGIADLLLPIDGTIVPQMDNSLIDPAMSAELSGSSFQSHRMNQVEPLDSASCCLMASLDLMKRLSSTGISSSGAPIGADKLSLDPHSGNQMGDGLLETIMQENKHAMDVVSNMVACTCASDGYLLTVLSMIVFKILARFSAAARYQPEPLHETDSVRLGEAMENDSALRPAQLVLGSLHLVQRLVNRLAPRIQSFRSRISSQWGLLGPEYDEFQISPLSGTEIRITPFATTMLDRVEKDLREAISNLSLEIIHTLRHS